MDNHTKQKVLGELEKKYNTAKVISQIYKFDDEYFCRLHYKSSFSIQNYYDITGIEYNFIFHSIKSFGEKTIIKVKIEKSN